MLVERVVSKQKRWTSKTLSYAGRVQLIKSVGFSLQVYWSSAFVLPKATLKEISHCFHHFLWNGKEDGCTKAKLARVKLSKPLMEEGLGIIDPIILNKAAQLKHTWKLCNPFHDSLRVR